MTEREQKLEQALKAAWGLMYEAGMLDPNPKKAKAFLQFDRMYRELGIRELTPEELDRVGVNSDFDTRR